MTKTGLAGWLLRHATGARNTQSLGGNARRVPKTAVVQDKERLRSVVRKIFSGKTPVGNCLLTEGAKPERVAGVPSTWDRLRLGL